MSPATSVRHSLCTAAILCAFAAWHTGICIAAENSAKYEESNELLSAVDDCAKLPISSALERCRGAVRLGLAESGIRTPDTRDFTLRIGRAYELERRYEQALTVFREGVRRFPEDADIHYQLGRLLVERFDAAEEAFGPFSEAVRRRPDFRDALLALAGVQYQLGYWQEAAKNYHSILTADPQCIAALIGLGRTLLSSGDTRESVTTLRKATVQSPETVDAWIALGEALLSAGQANESVPALLRAAELDADAPRPYCLLSEAYIKLGKHAEAREACTKARAITSHTAKPCQCQE